MGQLYTLLTGGIMKKDINVYYDTYGFEGERDYAVDGNGEYQPSDYDEVYDTNDHMSIKRQRNPTPVRINLSKIFYNISLIHSENLLTICKRYNICPFSPQPNSENRGKWRLCALIFLFTIIVAAVSIGGTPLYFTQTLSKGKTLSL